MRMTWTQGKHVTIDKIMIRHMGHAVSYIQYMPYKPVKHGIKVFALCCGYNAVIMLFIVYVGEEDNSENYDLKVCDKLCVDAGIVSVRS